MLLSLFFLLHWGSVAAYVLPGTEAGLDALPAWMVPPARAVLPRYVHNVWPVARPYLDLTSTRQSWALFAPNPSHRVSSIDVVSYVPASPERGGSGATA